MKSLLIAAVALLGFATPSAAQSDTYKLKAVVKFVTTDNADLSGQDIKIGFSSDDLQSVTPKDDGTCEIVKVINQDEYFNQVDYNFHLYWSINGVRGDYNYYGSSDDNNTITINADINLYKFRFNYSGTNITTYPITHYWQGEYTIQLAVNKDYYLTSTSYPITYIDASGTSRSLYLHEDTTIDLPTMYGVTIKVVEPDGTPVEGFSVSTSCGSRTTDANGTMAYHVASGTELTIFGSSFWDKLTHTIIGDKTIILNVPKLITIRATYLGKPVNYYSGESGQHNSLELLDMVNYVNGRISLESNIDGSFRGRVDENKDYLVSYRFYQYQAGGASDNAIRVTDGMTIRIGKFATQADGVGFDYYKSPGKSDINGAYDVIIGGSPLRIAAIPVGNEQFICWDINGKEYSSPMIDFTPKDDVTVATAKFSGEIANQVKSVAGQNAERINVTIEGDYLVLPADVDAEAAIYAMDGKLTKKTGVVGNRIYISNLPDGAFVLVLTADGRRQTATFVKQ